MPNIIAISGPTGIGKTKISIELAQIIQAEIISFDSRQIYKELNIGVARPSQIELNTIKHHLIAHKSIQDIYSAQDFVNEFHQIINDSNSNTKNYILVGGTGFYLRALEYGLDALPNVSEKTREAILNDFLEKGLKFIQDQVQEIDPKSFETMEIDNPRRLQRILEIWMEHKLVYSELISKNDEVKVELKHIVLDMDRELLYNRINLRVDNMIENGLEEEVKSLYQFRNLPSLNTVGYSEFFDYFDGQFSKAEAIEKIKQHSRNYAKRQITWNKKYLKTAILVNPLEENNYLDKIEKYVFS